MRARVRARVARALAALLAVTTLVAHVPVGASGVPPAGPVGSTGSPALPSDDDATRDAEARGRLFDAVVARVRETYFAPERIDWGAWSAAHKPAVVDADARPALDAAFRRAFAALGDGHSRWAGRDRQAAPGTAPAEAESRPDARHVRLGVRAEPLDGVGFLVTRVHPGGPADRAGLARGDVIVGVAGESLGAPGLGWRMQDRIAAALRTGAAPLEVRRPGTGAALVTVPAGPVPDGAESVPVAELDPATGVARIEIPSFGPGTAAAVHAAVASLREDGARALVLDLRGSPGGGVGEMGLVAALFARGATLEAWSRGAPDWTLLVGVEAGAATARLERRGGPYAGRDLATARLDAATRWTGPLAVLIDEGTASAAEGLAALAARAAGAPVVGTPSPGNVETVRRIGLPGGNAAWLAVGELRWPGGAAIVPIALSDEARLDPAALARGYDAPLAEAVRRLLDLPVTPGRWF